MPLIISQVRSSLSETPNEIFRSAIKSINISEKSVSSFSIYKTSLDARRNNDIHFVHSVMINLHNKNDEINLCKKNACCSLIESNRLSPVISKVKRTGDIIIAGFGPAGIFAGLILRNTDTNRRFLSAVIQLKAELVQLTAFGAADSLTKIQMFSSAKVEPVHFQTVSLQQG